MKKIILLFAAISTIMTSCQSDDDGAGPGSVDMQDPFVGTWKITQEFENGVEITLDACDAEDTLTVTADQKFSGTSHDLENGSCTLQETLTGSWENLGNNIYKITPDLPDAEEIQPTITFSGNTMTIVINDEEGEFRQILTRA